MNGICRYTTYDVVLKNYQLQQSARPTWNKDYDLVVIDEAQDTNPVCLAIISSQDTAMVVVGDMHQGIYGFRGAVDGLARMSGRVMSLTHSFRFGPSIAHLATCLLRDCKEETFTIVGLRTGDQVSSLSVFSHPLSTLSIAYGFQKIASNVYNLSTVTDFIRP